MSKLKPCPFCGSEEADIIASIDSEHGIECFLDELSQYQGECHNFYVCCHKCNGNSGYYRTQEEAIAAWNRRAEPVSKPMTREELWKLRLCQWSEGGKKMKRITTDTPQSNFDNMMNFVYDKDGNAYIRNDGKLDDVLLWKYMDRLCKEHGCEVESQRSSEETDWRCCDCARENGPDGNGCNVAIMYTLACQAVQCRGMLKNYEDACFPITNKYDAAIADAERRIGSYIAAGHIADDKYVMEQIAKIRQWEEERKDDRKCQ
jgi:Lar family restriction alleviation protein